MSRTNRSCAFLELSRSLLRARAAALAGCVALALGGCGTKEPDTAEANVEVTRSAITSTYSGAMYASQCLTDGVPLPPSWGTTTIGGNFWKTNPNGDKTFHDGFGGIQAGDVYFYVSNSAPQGLCVIAAHYDGPFDVICQGTNGRACFWEGPNLVIPPNPPLVIAGSGYSAGIKGGTDLPSHCTACHAGQNIFIAHNIANHPLNLAGTLGWMPSGGGYANPIAPPGWPQTTASTANYPAACTGCHQANAAGAFPQLDTAQFGGENYCNILQKVTSLPGSQGGMPPTAQCDPDNGIPCTQGDDPAIKKMLAACGAPTTPVPFSLSGIDAPGIGSQFLAARRHISISAPAEHQHYFYNASVTMPNAGCCVGQTSHPVLKPNDKIEVSVYMPVDDAPSELMIQAYDGSNWYRVSWGQQWISWPSTWKGLLPAIGSWQTLSFTPTDLGLPANSVLSGMAFTIFGGSASWADVVLRNSDSPYNGQYVSQVWVGDHAPPGAVLTGDGGDFWQWKPDDLAAWWTAYTSTTLYGADGSRAIDGNDDGNWADGSVFHTDATTDSSYLGLGTGGDWWYVDMGSLHTIRRVVLYNRTDCCQDRLSHFRINYWDPVYLTWRIASDQSNTITSAANPVIPINFPDVSTQYIMVQKADHNYLHLAEVEVYGDP
jgi:hypothetical protein